MAGKKQRMRLTAHADMGGSIRGIVIQAEGKISANLVPEPGVQVVDVAEHEFHGEVDHEQLMHFSDRYKVDITPATGKLVPMKGRAKKKR